MSKARDVADSYTDVEVDAKDATLQTQVNDRYTKAETDAAVAKLLRSDANDTHSGVITFTADGGGIAFSRNTDGAGVRFYNDSDSDTNSALNFHIADNGNEDFTWTGKSGPTTTELMRISPDGGQTGFKFRGNTVWHAGNDGAGSGLDADKLDGLDSSSFAQTAKITDSSVLDNVNLQPGFYNVEIKDLIPGYTADHYFVQHLGQYSGGGYSIQVAYPYTHGSTNYYFIRKATNNTWGYWAKCITEVSDGAGSGLDADTLDGQQGSYYQPASTAITTSNIGSQNVASADTANGLGDNITTSAGNFKIFTNDGGGNIGLRWNASGSGASLVENGQAYELEIANDSNNGDFVIKRGTTASGTAGDAITWNESLRIEGTTGAIHAAQGFVGDLTGVASTATKLATARTISLAGDVTGSVSWDGSGNASITATVADDSHNHTIANVDGLQTALDSKLNSTSYTAADVLTKIKTVDGAGSGLDADKLDGLDSSQFLRSDADDTMSGDLTIQNSDPSLILRDTDTMNPSNQAVRLRHNGRDNELPNGEGLGLIIDTPDTTGSDLTPAVITTGEFYAQNNQKVWHSGNDGSGSGLDADKLDGLDSSAFAPASHTHNELQQKETISYGASTLQYADRSGTGGGGNGQVPYNPTDDWYYHLIMNHHNSNGYYSDLALSFHTNNHYINRVNSGNRTTVKLWTDGNDGAGSGLDADTVDGIQASQFLRSDAADTASGKLTLNGGFQVNNVDWNDGLFRISGGSPHIEFDQTDGMRWQIGANGTSFFLLDDTNDNGFYDSSPYPFEISSSGVAKVNGGTVWHSGNDGSGSGLDADKLDGLHASQFLRSDTDDTMSGRLTVDTPADYDNTVITSMTNAPIYYPEVNVGTTNSFLPAFHMRSLHSSGYRTHMNVGLYKNTSGWGEGETGFYVGLGGNDSYPTEYFRMTKGGNIKHSNGYTFWHSGNDGAGSGLDADTVDGTQLDQIFACKSATTDFNTMTSPGRYSQGPFTSTNAPYSSPHGNLLVWGSGSSATNRTSQLFNDDGGNNLHFRSQSWNNIWSGWKKIWHSGNDGSGSGLDADTLDGLQASQFLRSDTNSNRELATNSNSSSYSAAAIELREYNKAGSQTGAWSEAPRLAFHWGGRVAASIALSNDSDICIMNNPGTGYEDLRMRDCKVYGTLIESSDARLKENVSTLTSSLNAVSKLRGVSYNKIDSEKEEIGFIAQEVEEVVPALVETDSEGMKAVSYGRTVALLVEAMKEQQAQIEELKLKLKEGGL